MARTNWRAVADRLAGRMLNHAFNCLEGHEPADPDCPFCEDTAAYLAYLDAGGTVRHAPERGRCVPVHEISEWASPEGGPAST